MIESKSTDKLEILASVAHRAIRKNAPIMHKIKELRIEWVTIQATGSEAVTVPNITIVFKEE